MTVEDEGAVALNGDDPTGFLGQENFVHKRLFRGVAGFLAGGPVGAAAGLLSGGPGRQRPQIAPPGVPQAVVRVPGVRGVGQRLAPGGATGFQVNAPQAVAAGTKLACASGHHPNRSSYFLMSGEFVPEGSRCVRNRRRNPMNPRALSRSIARIDGAKGLQGKLAEITTAKWTAAGKRKH